MQDYEPVNVVKSDQGTTIKNNHATGPKGKITQSFNKRPGRSGFVDGWHEFVSVHANGQWVVVGVNTGASYAGFIQTADPEKKTDGRDVILAEPAVYVADQEKYLSLPYHSLFLSGKIIDSVAIARNESNGRPKKPELAFSYQEGTGNPG